MKFPTLSEEFRLKRLQHPEEKLHMVLDTDTYNEVDDQFALAYAALSGEKLILDAVYAAPFINERAETEEEGMEKSYAEILRILSMLELAEYPAVYKGSRHFMPDSNTPVVSNAAEDLVKRAIERTDEDPLYVVAIGAPTNVASAILMEPEIIRRIVVLWLGGQALECEDARDFNLKQDIYASHVLLDSGVPLVLFPCERVTTHLLTTVPELKYYLQGKNRLASYLVEIVENYKGNSYGWSKVIWDVVTVAWLLSSDWVPTKLIPSPILTDQYTWKLDPKRDIIRYAYYLHKDPIFADLFSKISKQNY